MRTVRPTCALSLLAVAAAAGAFAGCGGGGGGGIPTTAKPPTQIQLQEENGSGQSGLATLTALEGKTRVVISMQSGPTTHQPVRIHAGTCTSLDPTPAYPLNDIVGGRSTTVVDVSLDALERKPYVINVHKSPRNLKIYVACGSIGENSAPAVTYTNAGD
jgi:hypothetical protein